MEDDDTLVEIRGGSKPPFWLLHPIGGNVLFGHLFADHLPTDQPLIGIQARGLNGRCAPFVSIYDAARFYLSAIRKRQPKGPYFLGGPSFGGNVAFEMASILASEGERVGLLALFDAFGPDYPRLAPLHTRVQARLKRGLRSTPAVSAQDALYAVARIPEGQSQELATLRRVGLAHLQALRTYRPSHYPGRLHLFRAEVAPSWEGLLFDDETNGWDKVVSGGVESISVPGTHQYILDPPWVHTLISEFTKVLVEVTDPQQQPLHRLSPQR